MMNAPTAGTRFGPYELLEQLGEGGMGKVFKANDTRLERTVAIKIPLFIKKDDDQNADEIDCHIKRFYREAKLAAKIKHRNVCAIHAVDEIDGNHYLDLEYIEGADLAVYLAKRGGKLPPIEAADIVAKVASGMHALHKKGVVHRDLKPQNIMIDDELQPVILDFGLAKGVDDTELSLSGGGFLGTLRYASPEQLKDKQLRDLPTTDIYSLGAILYELISGRYADEGNDEITVIGSKMNLSPSLIDIVPGISQSLNDICMKMLSESPKSRQASMTVVEKELQNFLFELRLKSTDGERKPIRVPIDIAADEESEDSSSQISQSDFDKSMGYYDSGSLIDEESLQEVLDEESEEENQPPSNPPISESVTETASNSGMLQDSRVNPPRHGSNGNDAVDTRPKRRLTKGIGNPFFNRRLLGQIEQVEQHATITGNIDDHFMVDLFHGSQSLQKALHLYALDAGYKLIAEVDYELKIDFPVEGRTAENHIRRWKRTNSGRLKQLLDLDKSTFILFRVPERSLPASAIKNFKKGVRQLLEWRVDPQTIPPKRVLFVVPKRQFYDLNSYVSDTGISLVRKIDIGLPDKDELNCFFDRISLRMQMSGDAGSLAEYAKRSKKSLVDVETDLAAFLQKNPVSRDLNRLYASTKYQ